MTKPWAGSIARIMVAVGLVGLGLALLRGWTGSWGPIAFDMRGRVVSCPGKGPPWLLGEFEPVAILSLFGLAVSTVGRGRCRCFCRGAILSGLLLSTAIFLAPWKLREHLHVRLVVPIEKSRWASAWLKGMGCPRWTPPIAGVNITALSAEDGSLLTRSSVPMISSD